jgi:hypothetical protein
VAIATGACIDWRGTDCVATIIKDQCMLLLRSRRCVLRGVQDCTYSCQRVRTFCGRKLCTCIDQHCLDKIEARVDGRFVAPGVSKKDQLSSVL